MGISEKDWNEMVVEGFIKPINYLVVSIQGQTLPYGPFKGSHSSLDYNSVHILNKK